MATSDNELENEQKDEHKQDEKRINPKRQARKEGKESENRIKGLLEIIKNKINKLIIFPICLINKRSKKEKISPTKNY
ncbi:hypothetical protein BBW65_05655 [Helicobacter enhydrae]|uniref:Uncharacterized protein n=1 Tax=Helicobacter enhydrae TaxID=222136 RepID=A0A1B1U689_9HELI|nr:hypothetical protein [Helicobacter enhydrae]ANV98314.1 hypothetical protein BBW65_05655 [Helicobacter enhydrae]